MPSVILSDKDYLFWCISDSCTHLVMAACILHHLNRLRVLPVPNNRLGQCKSMHLRSNFSSKIVGLHAIVSLFNLKTDQKAYCIAGENQ
jgi:hypothetical protein